MCDLYYTPASSPCRVVQMVAAALKVKLRLKPINLHSKEHLLPEFLKINPQHTVPTLVDNNFALWESRSICIYLVEKYAKDDSLYPKNPKQRALVNQRLYFDMGMLTKRMYDFFFPQLIQNTQPDPQKFKEMEEAIELLDIFLENSAYAAGDKLTIADFALAVTVSVCELTGYDLNKYVNISRWYEAMKLELPGWNINEEGLNVLRQYIKK
ncbi:glutathione S-transferase 1-1-like [Chironomus tepperi]|uniref:glutathione S-transferase 1-1-like n=1 Tax=Chironomus tepperi TaxID=113505 RepID=UPI00391F3474